MPRLVRIAYPDAVFSGHEDQVGFTVEGNAGTAIGIQISAMEARRRRRLTSRRPRGR